LGEQLAPALSHAGTLTREIPADAERKTRDAGRLVHAPLAHGLEQNHQRILGKVFGHGTAEASLGERANRGQKAPAELALGFGVA
jgi:hypothetical protein